MGKRPLVSFTLALLGGLFFSEAFFYFPLTLSFILSLLLLAELAFFRGRRLSFSLFLVGLAGFLVHQILAVPFSDQDLRHYIDQGPIRIIAQVSGPLRHDARHVRLQMKARALLIKGKEHPIQGDFHLNLWEREIPFEYGDLLEMEIKLRRPKQFQNAGAFQYADYRERTGWSGVANLSNLDRITKVGEDGNLILKQIFRWRDEIRRRILKTFEPRTGGLLMALVIGETGYLPEEVRGNFAASGTAHLLAVSGAHLVFVSLLVFGLLRFLLLRLPEGILLRLTLWKIPSQWAALITALASILYTLLAGAKIGTLRALTMILVYLLSIWMGRSRDTYSALALACLLIITFEPRAIFEISFQLSFLSVLFILLLLEWQRKRDDGGSDFLGATDEKERAVHQRICSAIFLMMQSTIGATLGTLPLSLYYFHQFSWVGLFSNLIVLPFVGWFIVPLGLLTSLIALLLPEGFPFVEVHEKVLSIFLDLISLFAELPGADKHFASPPILLIVLYYSIFVTILILKKPGRVLLGFSLIFGLLFFVWGGIRISPGHLRVTFLDVGQGDATLIEFANGQTLLIDGGTETAGKFGIAPYLWQRRIDAIDVLIATHPQFDHMGGFSTLIRSFKIGEVWSNGRQSQSDHYQKFLKALQVKGLKQEIVSNQSPPIIIDGCQLVFLNPEESGRRDEMRSNNDSIVLRLSCPTGEKQNLSFLFTGDIEAEAEQRLLEGYRDVKSRILKVPHHGSRSSSGREFISAVSPEMAIISAGRKNRYRHPHPSVLKTYGALGVEIYRSDRDGAITVEPEQKPGAPILPFQVQTYRSNKIKRIIWAENVPAQEWENINRFFVGGS